MSVRAFFKAYVEAFKKYPIRMNMLNGGMIMCMGDNIAQHFEQRGQATTKSHDFQRTGIMMSYNMFISCPFWLTFYGILDSRWPVDTLLACVKKSFMCQLVGSFTCILFVSYSTLMRHAFSIAAGEERTAYQVAADVGLKVKEKLPTMLGVGILFWIPNNTTIFYFIPRHLRLLYGNCLSIMWSSFLSWVQHLPDSSNGVITEVEANDGIRW
mmetsp:Transcript_7011/g.10623  ORF Transcript_7011/g.10623 Transcript_7011/m.10623 type:complete len:212 (+) Transcript_7011:30-665(+)